MTDRLVLASASASRARMLADAGVVCDIEPAHVDEAAIKAAMLGDGASAEDIAMALAVEKAQVISNQFPDALIVGADQILVCQGKLYDKPIDMAGAADHLQSLSGQVHHLVTAACVVRAGDIKWQHLSSPNLTMRSLDRAFIDAYLAQTGEKALQSVGAYQLEGLGAQLFSTVDGDFFSILGLPLLPLLAFLRDENIV